MITDDDIKLDNALHELQKAKLKEEEGRRTLEWLQHKVIMAEIEIDNIRKARNDRVELAHRGNINE